MRSHFHDAVRDNGLPITVEYEADGRYGGYVCYIIEAWPRDVPWRERLDRLVLFLRWRLRQRKVPTALGWKLAKVLSLPFDAILWLDAWWRCSLTDAERDRIDAEITENYTGE